MTVRLNPLIATALVGIGSVVTVAMSVVTMKIYALLVGPSGIGIFALLQSILSLSIIAASLGLQASTIALVASADRRAGRGESHIVGRTAIMVAAVTGGTGAVGLLLLSTPIAETILGSAGWRADVAILAPTLLFTVVATVGAAVLAGLQRLRIATGVTVITAAAAAAAGIAFVASFGIGGFAPSLVVAALVQIALTLYAVKRVGLSLLRRPLSVARHAVRELIALGAPVALSQAVSTGALMIVPVLVFQSRGAADVGYYRAAAAISIGMGAFFTAGIHQDFLPRMAAAHESERAVLVERRMRIVIGIGMPAILAILALGPAILDVLYTDEFHPAIAVLQWQLIGDLVRLPALVLAFSALAIYSPRAYFAIEAVGGLTLVLGTVLGLAVVGLAGPGIGYAAAQLATYVVAWIVIGRRIHAIPGRLQGVVGTVLLAASLVLLTDPSAVARLLIFGTAAIGTAAISWPRLIRLHRASEL